MKKLILNVTFLFGSTIFCKAQIINTIAGTGVFGFSGDGGAATNAQLHLPFGVAVDASGNVYIADNINNRIRKVNTAGIISTFAGTGVAGFNGDGGAATNAQLNFPTGLTIDAVGNIYIVDCTNNRIRKVNTAGIISTFAGTGVAGFSGDGGAANNAQLNYPYGIAFDASGNAYIADDGNSRIRKVNMTGVISTFAGTGVAGFSGDGAAANLAQLNLPRAVTVDVLGNVYIADVLNNRIRKINTAGVISTFAGTGVAGYNGDGGVATNAQLLKPHGVTFDATGNMYIADMDNYRIRKINTFGIISTFAGTGAQGFTGDGGIAMNAQLNQPMCITLDALGNAYIADLSNSRIRKINSCITSTVTANATATNICTGTSVTLTASGANTYTWSNGSNFASTIVTPTINSTYTVIGTNNGCGSSSKTISIVVNAIPSLTIVSTSTLSCSGPTVILTASGANTYTWSTGANANTTIVTPTVTTNYSVTGTDVNGCKNSVMKNITVTQPAAQSSNTLLCSGQTATLIVLGATTYTWSTGANTNIIVVTPTVTSTYTVTGNNAGCNYTTTVTEIVTTCADITELAATGNEPIAFPNPFIDHVNIVSNKESYTNVLLKIYNTLGSTVYASKLENEKAEIDLSHLQSGIYFLEVYEEGNISRIKLVKN